MKTAIRVVVAVLLGNGLGYGAFRLAGEFTNYLWSGGPPADFGALLWRICLTAMAFSTPPVIIGAVMARIAGKFEPWVGVGSAMWGLTAKQWWPATVPLLPPESWIAPMGLILLSGLMGGWLVGSRPPLTPVIPPSLSEESSKDTVI
jgi:hypothetical protein